MGNTCGIYRRRVSGEKVMDSQRVRDELNIELRRENLDQRGWEVAQIRIQTFMCTRQIAQI
jgi:hypothetical protein